MATDQKFKDVATEMFSHFGYDVTQIEELPDTQTPDLCLVRGQERILLELKTREDDRERLSREEAEMREGRIVEGAEPMGRRNTISAIVADAVKQLTAFATNPNELRLVWIHSAGRDPETQHEQVKSTVYGLTDIVDMDGSDNIKRPCYYFYHSDFYRHRQYLDGLITTLGDQAQLCINDQSPRADCLRKSHVCHSFGEGVLDPLVKEAAGDAYVADCDVDRREKGKVLLYLQKKYGRQKLVNIDMVKYSAAILANSGE